MFFYLFLFFFAAAAAVSASAMHFPQQVQLSSFRLSFGCNFTEIAAAPNSVKEDRIGVRYTWA